MNEKVILIILFMVILIVLLCILYHQLIFQIEFRKRLREISGKLAEIIDQDSDEAIMVFTDNRELQNLAGQINRLLDKHRKRKADYRRMEISSKKMLSNISHDLKTPLTVILGYLEIMQLQGSSDQMLAKVEEKAKQVMELIHQFFTLAKLEAGDTCLKIERINLNETCRENILGFYEMLSMKMVEVEISMPETDIYVQGDQDAINRILFNLLSNAVRYGLDGNYIGLKLHTDQDYAYIDIIDKGKGIEKAFATAIFERLYTMEDSRNRRIQGNGLGLTIARNLSRQMGGELTLESEPFEKTVFTVKLKKSISCGERNL